MEQHNEEPKLGLLRKYKILAWSLFIVKIMLLITYPIIMDLSANAEYVEAFAWGYGIIDFLVISNALLSLINGRKLQLGLVTKVLFIISIIPISFIVGVAEFLY